MRFNAGYAKRIPSGTLTPDFMHKMVRAATKFPPALSPTKTTYLGFMSIYYTKSILK